VCGLIHTKIRLPGAGASTKSHRKGVVEAMLIEATRNSAIDWIGRFGNAGYVYIDFAHTWGRRWSGIGGWPTDMVAKRSFRQRRRRKGSANVFPGRRMTQLNALIGVRRTIISIPPENSGRRVSVFVPPWAGTRSGRFSAHSSHLGPILSHLCMRSSAFVIE
jgi:hypothetical protein